jgi:hypothetical protein
MNRDLLPRVVRVSDLPEGCFRGLLSSTDRSIKRSWKAFMKFILRSGLLFGKVKNILLMDSIGFAQFKKKLFQDVITDVGMEGVTVRLSCYYVNEFYEDCMARLAQSVLDGVS